MAKTTTERGKAWRERQLADPEKAKVYREKRATIARGKYHRDQAEIKRLREQSAKNSHTVKLKYTVDALGSEMARFASDLEARTFLTRMQEIAMENPGISPVSMLSPFLQGVVQRWFNEGNNGS